ncbi:glycosyltransferase [Lachnospiraceae bacterium WCA3-601-WT-6H]|uniref:Glycosyltransferase n=2 Tax=Waltera intestinalis TaxID=2606635 RepID=A0A6L5YJ81_9FIRM|nr:glycosyltransferase [Waltera intestinalis]
MDGFTSEQIEKTNKRYWMIEDAMDRKEDALISVIVTAYNVETYLDECIKSILNQTYSNLEVILVDDGSTDAVPEICDKWMEQDKRIKVIHKMNGGCSSAKNTGMAAATGDYIGFVDGDDYIVPEYYETLLTCLLETNSDIVRTGMQRVDEDGNFLSSVIPKTATYNSYEALQCLGLDDGIFIMNSLSLSKKKVFCDVVFPEGRVCEDAAMAHVMFCNAEKLTVLCGDLYRYRIVSNSIMHSKMSVSKLDIVEALYNRFVDYEKKGYTELLLDTCNIAKNKMWMLATIPFTTREEHLRKNEIIRMYRYMYKNTPAHKSIQCKLCYMFPRLYNWLKVVFKR